MFNRIKQLFKKNKKLELPEGLDFYTFDLTEDFIMMLDARRLFYQKELGKDVTMGMALEQLIQDYEYALQQKQIQPEENVMEYYLFEEYNQDDPMYG